MSSADTAVLGQDHFATGIQQPAGYVCVPQASLQTGVYAAQPQGFIAPMAAPSPQCAYIASLISSPLQGGCLVSPPRERLIGVSCPAGAGLEGTEALTHAERLGTYGDLGNMDRGTYRLPGSYGNVYYPAYDLENVRTVRGEIVSILPGSVVIRFEGAPQSSLVDVRTRTDTLFYSGDERIDYNDLKEGDFVWIDYAPDERGKATAHLIALGEPGVLPLACVAWAQRHEFRTQVAAPAPIAFAPLATAPIAPAPAAPMAPVCP
jgi:hypothetical protein